MEITIEIKETKLHFLSAAGHSWASTASWNPLPVCPTLLPSPLSCRISNFAAFCVGVIERGWCILRALLPEWDINFLVQAASSGHWPVRSFPQGPYEKSFVQTLYVCFSNKRQSLQGLATAASATTSAADTTATLRSRPCSPPATQQTPPPQPPLSAFFPLKKSA